MEKINGATLLTPLPKEFSFNDWEHEVPQYDLPKLLEFSFPKTSLICFQSDQHVYAEQWEKKRLEDEVNSICSTKNVYVSTLGDIINGMFWNPGQFEESQQVPVQIRYARSMLKYMSESGSLLFSIAGDHDKWMKKTGMDMYFDFSDTFKAHYCEGITYARFTVGDIEYHWGGAHKLNGSSIYNNTHPEMRAEKTGGLWGCDVIVGAHTHKKGHTTQSITEFPGVSREVHYSSLGPYKPTDSYLRKQGYNKQNPVCEEMFGCAYMFSGKKKKVYYYDDILEGIEEMKLVNDGLIDR